MIINFENQVIFIHHTFYNLECVSGGESLGVTGSAFITLYVFQVVDPWGCILGECHDEPDVSIVSLSPNYQERKRQEMPVWKHRRHDVYGHVQTQSSGILYI